MAKKRRTTKKPSKDGAVELSEQDLDSVSAAGAPGVTTGAFKGVDGLSAEIKVIEYQDGDDLFLRKRPVGKTGG